MKYIHECQLSILFSLLVFVLVGCGAQSTRYSKTRGFSEASSSVKEVKKSKGTGHWVITGKLHLSVDSIQKTIDKINQDIGQYQGNLTQSKWSQKRYNESATLVLRISSTHFPEALKWLKKMGKVTREDMFKEEVSKQMTDHNVLLSNAKSLLKKLGTLLEKRESSDEVKEVASHFKLA